METDGFKNIGFAKIDTDREARTGFPEVIYCQGKTAEQCSSIFRTLYTETTGNILGTRCDIDKYKAIKACCPDACYDEISSTVYIRRGASEQKGNIAVLSAGTSDYFVSEEAAITAELMGNRVTRIYDVGVSGIHRLLAYEDKLREANVLIVVAGMDGALPSVVGGLVDKPVIAVPTDVGYGANFKGLSALLAMLNSCAAGVTVVNINNGFGAGAAASRINRLAGE